MTQREEKGAADPCRGFEKGIPLKVTSDDEIRVRSQIEIPAGVRIECAAADDGHHVLSFGGSVFDGPRLVLDLQPGVADQLLTAVAHERGNK